MDTIHACFYSLVVMTHEQTGTCYSCSDAQIMYRYISHIHVHVHVLVCSSKHDYCTVTVVKLVTKMQLLYVLNVHDPYVFSGCAYTIAPERKCYM